jgi:hypothetical protein
LAALALGGALVFLTGTTSSTSSLSSSEASNYMSANRLLAAHSNHHRKLTSGCLLFGFALVLLPAFEAPAFDFDFTGRSDSSESRLILLVSACPRMTHDAPTHASSSSATREVSKEYLRLIRLSNNAYAYYPDPSPVVFSLYPFSNRDKRLIHSTPVTRTRGLTLVVSSRLLVCSAVHCEAAL